MTPSMLVTSRVTTPILLSLVHPVLGCSGGGTTCAAIATAFARSIRSRLMCFCLRDFLGAPTLLKCRAFQQLHPRQNALGAHTAK